MTDPLGPTGHLPLDTTAVQLLDAAVPAVPDAGPHDPRLRLLVPHALALLGHVGESSAADALAVTTRLATALHRTGDYVSARETARNAADLAQRHLDADHRAVLAARSRAGRALFRLGRYAEADREIRQVAEVYERRFGPEYPIVLAARQLLSRTRAALGHREEGIALMTDVVERRDRGLGPEHPFTVASRNLLDAYRSGRWRP